MEFQSFLCRLIGAFVADYSLMLRNSSIFGTVYFSAQFFTEYTEKFITEYTFRICKTFFLKKIFEIQFGVQVLTNFLQNKNSEVFSTSFQTFLQLFLEKIQPFGNIQKRNPIQTFEFSKVLQNF